MIYTGADASFSDCKGMIVRCGCGMCDSELEFSWCFDHPKNQHVCIHMSVQVTPWWKRIGEAIRHIVRPRRYFGYPDKLLLDRKEVMRLGGILMEAMGDDS